MQRVLRGAQSTLSLPPLLGAVLAGGASRRLGRDKAREVVSGKTLVDRAAGTLSRVFSQVAVISSNPPDGTEWSYVPDLRPGLGPLAAIEAALEHAGRLGVAGVFILACDLPLVDEGVVRAVASGVAGAAAVAPERSGTPAMEPLCAVYRSECLPVVRTALDRGERAVHPVFRHVGGVLTRVPEEKLLNLNTPAELARAEAILRDRNP